MEFLTILLSGLLALVSPVNLATDSIVEGAIRSRFDHVEQLQVRVDNAPNYQIVQGKVERVRIAGRGLWLTPEMRIGVLEVETDPINLDLQRLRQGNQPSPRAVLRQPVQAAVHLVLTESDLNQALQSPAVMAQLRRLSSRFLGSSVEGYEFLNPRVEMLGNNRVRLQVDVREGATQPQVVIVESGLSLVAGHRLELLDPAVSINGIPLPNQVAQGFARGISNRFDLRILEEAGITARLLKLNVNTGELDLAAFVRLDSLNQLSTPSTGTDRQ